MMLEYSHYSSASSPRALLLFRHKSNQRVRDRNNRISKRHKSTHTLSLSLCLSLHFTLSLSLSLRRHLTVRRLVPAAGLSVLRRPPLSLYAAVISVLCSHFRFIRFFSSYQNKHRREYKMIGSFLTRGLAMVFGYAYPAYECFKTVEKNKPDIEQLRFWCQYWILVAVLTVGERICDTFISWVPMYSEAKLAFFIYLWYPKTKGTTYVYDSFFRPYIAKHEPEIDRNLLELRTRAGDIAVLYWQRAASYGQSRIFEILQYIAAQSTPTSRPAQPQQQGPRTRQPKRKPAAKKTPPPNEEPSSPASSASSSEDEHEEAQESNNSQVATATPPSTALNAQQSTTVAPPLVALNAQKATTVVEQPAETSNHSNSNETETMQIESASSSANKNGNPPVQETVMEEAIRVTRGRLRKSRSTADR